MQECPAPRIAVARCTKKTGADSRDVCPKDSLLLPQPRLDCSQVCKVASFCCKAENAMLVGKVVVFPKSVMEILIFFDKQERRSEPFRGLGVLDRSVRHRLQFIDIDAGFGKGLRRQ